MGKIEKVEGQINIGSNFDPQGIIDGLRKMRKVLFEATSVQPEAFKDFSKVLNEAQTKTDALKKSLAGGLITNSDVKNYEKMSREIQSALTSAIKMMSSLGGQSFQAYESDFRKSVSGFMQPLLAEKDRLEKDLSMSLRRGGSQSAFAGLDARSYIKRVSHGQSFDEIFSPYRRQLEEALSQAQQPVESLTNEEQKKLKELREQAKNYEEQLKVSKSAVSVLKTQQKNNAEAKKQYEANIKATVTKKEVGRFDLSGLLSLLPSVEGYSQTTTSKMLRSALQSAFSSTSKTSSIYTQFSRSMIDPSNKLSSGKFFNLQNLSAGTQQLIQEELRKLFQSTSRGSAISSYEQSKQTGSQLAQQLSQESQNAKTLEQNLEKVNGQIAIYEQKENAAAVQASQLTQAQAELESFNEWEKEKGRPAYVAFTENEKRIDDLRRGRELGLSMLKDEYDKMGENLEGYKGALKEGEEQTDKFAKSQYELIGVQKDVEETFNQLTSHVKYLFSIFTIYRTVSNVIKQTYSDLQNLDKAFGSIAMVTSKTVNDLWSSYSQYADIANRLGQSTENAIQTSALFYQQGLDTVEVLQLTESTMKLATLAGQDFETSTQELTAALRAFHLEMSEGEHVTDVYSELAAHAAADVSNIAAAMSKVASIASSAGSSFENTAAFLTQIIETTQESGVNAGTALKTIVARFTELKENVDDIEGDLEDLDYNKVDKALKSVGINLKDSQGQIRDFDEIIIELSTVWDSLSRNQQRYIATTAAGSRQQSRFIALLEDHERLMDLIGIATDSTGRSSQQFAKYADTIEFRLAKLKNTWEQFRISLIDEKTVKKVLDSVQGILSRILDFNWLDWTTIGATFLTLGKFVAENLIKGMKSISIAGLGLINNVANFVPNLISRRSGVAAGELAQSWNGKEWGSRARFMKAQGFDVQIDEDTGKLFVDGLQYNEADIDNLTKKWQAISEEKGTMIGATFATALTGAISTSLLQDDPLKVLSDTMTASVPMLISTFANVAQVAYQSSKKVGYAITEGLSATAWGLIISAAVAGLAAGFKALNNYIKKNAEASMRANNAYYDSIKNIEELEKRQEELRTEIAKTSEEVDKSKEAYESLAEKGDRLKALSSQIALTSGEQEEFNTLSNEIAQNYPQLVESYDAEGNAIVNLTEQYEALVKWKKESYELDQLKYNQGTLLDAEYSYLTAIQEERGGEDIKRFLTEGIGREMLNPTKDYTFEWNEELQRYDLVGGASQRDNILSILSTADKTTGKTLRKILENNAYFSDLAGIEDEKVGQKIQEIIIDNTAAYNSFLKSLEQGIPNPEVLKHQREEAEQNFNQILDTSLEFSLSRAGIYEGIDNKNVQSLMAKYVISKTGISSELIEKEFEKEFQGKDVTDEDFQNFFLERVRNIMESTDLDNLTKDFSTDFWKSFYKNFSDKNYYDQYMKVTKSSEITDAEKELWLQETEIIKEGWNKRVEEISKILEIEAVPKSWEDQASIKAFEGTPFANALLKSGDTFIEKFKELDKENSTLAKHFTEDLSEIYNEIGEENFLELLNNTDWSEYDIVNADEFWSAVAKNLDNPDSFDQVKKVFEKYFIDSDLILDEIFEKAEDKYDEIINTELSAYEKAISSYRENGYIDASALKALRKANAPLQDIINEDYTLNENAITQWIQGRVTEIEHLDATIRKDYQNRVSALESILDGENEVTKEKALQVALQAKLAGALTSSDYVRLQNQLTDDSKENAEILSKIIDDLKDEYDESAISKIVSGYATAANAALSGIEDSLAKKAEEMAEKVEKANKAVEDSYQDILDKQQDLIDKQKELNEAIYGTDTYKSSLDPLYNYSTALDVLSESIDEAKESLDNLDGQNPTEILDSLFDSTHQKAAYLLAENDRYRAAISNIESALTNELVQYLTASGRGLSTNVEDYFRFNPIMGFYEINDDALRTAQMSDPLKIFISEQTSTMNDYLKNIRSNNKEYKSLQKDFTDYQKKVRDDYISIQDEVVEKLKESYQKEIDDKKEMYDALEEADNDYLDALEKAIDKQRKLRDRQDKWNNLSTKEKRLSLLQRDTSGANRKETQKLQQEIQDERQSLLDETVDSVIDNLKELYETQQESREAEIEYQQSVLDNANLVVEANAIMQSWKSLDDMRAWMWEHTDGIEKMSDQAVEKLTEDWAEMFDNIQEYNALQQAEVSDIFEVTSNEIQSIVWNTTESLTIEASRALQEVTQNVEDSIKNAQDAVTNAMKALTDAQTKYNEAIAEYNELIKDVRKKDDTENPEETAEAFSFSFTTPYETAAIREARLKAMRDVVGQYTNKQDFLNNFSSYQDEAEEVWREYSLKTNNSNLNAGKKVEIFGPSSLTSTGLTTTTTAIPVKSPLAQLIEKSKARQEEEEKNFWFKNYNYQQAYASGGLVDYTGPAWVDGTKRKPESFLSAEDTIRIGQAASILRDLVSYRQSGLTLSSFTPNSGDTTIQLTINVDSIATEDQVDYLIDRMKEEITDAANPMGSSVIFR